jgi:long-subunit acyl-CoA synthetase (AMP-forming)
MFSPMFLENKLKFSPYIKEAVIFGDKRDFVAALINIDPIVVGKWAEDRGISYTTFMDLSAQTGGGRPDQRSRWRNQPRAEKSTSGSNALPSSTSCWMWTTAN